MNRVLLAVVGMFLCMGCASEGDEPEGASESAILGDPASAKKRADEEWKARQAAERAERLKTVRREVAAPILEAYRLGSTHEFRESYEKKGDFIWAVPSDSTFGKLLEELDLRLQVFVSVTPSRSGSYSDLQFDVQDKYCSQEVGCRFAVLTCSSVAKDAGPSAEQCRTPAQE